MKKEKAESNLTGNLRRQSEDRLKDSQSGSVGSEAFAMLIGTGLAENVKTGDVKAFQKALEGWIHCTTRQDRLFGSDQII